MSFELSVDPYEFMRANFQLHHPTSQRSILFAFINNDICDVCINHQVLIDYLV